MRLHVPQHQSISCHPMSQENAWFERYVATLLWLSILSCLACTVQTASQTRSPHSCQKAENSKGADDLQHDCGVLQWDSKARPARLLGSWVIPNGVFMQLGLFSFEAVPKLFKECFQTYVYFGLQQFNRNLIVNCNPKESNRFQTIILWLRCFQLTSSLKRSGSHMPPITATRFAAGRESGARFAATQNEDIIQHITRSTGGSK